MVFTVTQMSLSLSVHCITAHTVAFTYYISSWEVGHILCTSIAGVYGLLDKEKIDVEYGLTSDTALQLEWLSETWLSEKEIPIRTPSQVGRSIERRKSRSELKVEGVCLWMNQYVDGNCPQRQAMLQSARWQWSMKDELRNCKRKYHNPQFICLCWGPRGSAHGKYKMEVSDTATCSLWLEVSKI